MRALRIGTALFLAVLLAACAHIGAGSAPGIAMRAMTYNIRLDLASDGPNAWPGRSALVAQVIAHEAPDVLAMQEVLAHQKRDLEVALPGYAAAGVGRDDGREGGEFSPLFWRRDRFHLVRSGTFWLSPTPAVPGKGWDAAYPRIATWAVLRDRRSGRSVRVLGTHFDHLGTVARAESARMIARWVSAGPDAALPTIVMGDLNAQPGSDPYRLLAGDAAAGLYDARTATRTPAYGPPGTFTGFDITAAAPAPIDHVFTTPPFVTQGYAVVTQHWGGRLPSDHYPVVVDLTLP